MGTKVKSAKDFLMLLLYAKGHDGKSCAPIIGRTRLMKMVFLFDKEIRKEFNLDKVIPPNIMPKFIAYDYGPFSSDIYSDLEFLVELGFVKVMAEDGNMSDEEIAEYRYWQVTTSAFSDDDIPTKNESFSLTNIGREFVEKGHAGSLSANQQSIIDDFKARCTGISLHALLKYVYAKHPKMAGKSKIKNRFAKA